MPECPQCGADYEEGHKICEVCGVDLEQSAEDSENPNFVKCLGCGLMVSKLASRCPSCGAAINRKTPTVIRYTVLIIVVIALVLVRVVEYKADVKRRAEQDRIAVIVKQEKARKAAIEKQKKEKERAARIEQKKKDAAERKAEREQKQRERERKRAEQYEKCKLTLECWGERHSLRATFAAEKLIEKHAKYDFQWTDGWLEPKVSRMRWLDKNKLTLMYFGDKIKFQNGFGAWQNMIYRIDFDPINEKLLGINIQPGRL